MTTAVRVGNDHWKLIKQDTVSSFSSVICSLCQKENRSDLQLNLKMPAGKGHSSPAEKISEEPVIEGKATTTPLSN